MTTANTRTTVALFVLNLSFGGGRRGTDNVDNNLIDVQPEPAPIGRQPGDTLQMPVIDDEVIALANSDELDENAIETTPMLRARPAAPSVISEEKAEGLADRVIGQPEPNVLTKDEATELAGWVQANEPTEDVEPATPVVELPSESAPPVQIIKIGADSDYDLRVDEAEAKEEAATVRAASRSSRVTACLAAAAIVLMVIAGGLMAFEEMAKANSAGDGYAATAYSAPADGHAND